MAKNVPIEYNKVEIAEQVTGQLKYRTAIYSNLMRGKVYAEVMLNDWGTWDAMVWDDDDREAKARWWFNKKSKRAAIRSANYVLRQKGVGVE